ncbi:hypothetical protein Tco_1277141 [Tanacetum coccineum]
MVAFLSKPAESEGFEQIVDFLNAHPIKHALMVNPTIYTSFIETILDEAVYKELDDSLVRASTTASSLEAELDSGKIIKTQSKATPNEDGSLQVVVPGNTLRSGEDSLKLNELMELCTNLQQRVLDLENTKTTQAEEIVSLKRRVKKLKQKKRSRTHGLKRLYKVGLTTRVESSGDEESLGVDASKQGRINAIDADEDITLVNDQDDADMFDVNTLTGDEVLAEQEVTSKDVNLTVDEVTLAQALAALKSVKPKLHAEEEEEERLAREKAQQIKEANIAWDDVQANVEADYQFAQRLQAQEQEELTDEEKARLFVQFLEQRRKHFAAKRAEEKRNKPPTQDQQRKIICTYMKNMEGKKPKDLKNKSFDSIQKMFDKDFKKVNTFFDFRTDLVEGSSKRAGTELEQEVTKKQKVDDVQETVEVDDDQEIAKIKELMKIVSDEEEVAIDAIPLATKPPTSID